MIKNTNSTLGQSGQDDILDSSFLESVDSPILKPLSEKMKVDLLLGHDGQVTILHSGRLPYLLKWVEFDPDNQSISFVSEAGHMQPLGVAISQNFEKAIEGMHDIAVVMKSVAAIESFRIVPFINIGGSLN